MIAKRALVVGGLPGRLDVALVLQEVSQRVGHSKWQEVSITRARESRGTNMKGDDQYMNLDARMKPASKTHPKHWYYRIFCGESGVTEP